MNGTGELTYGRHTENLIEIAWVYAMIFRTNQSLSEIDSTTWKQEFVDWANEFEKVYPDPDYWNDNDYFECIEKFARKKISEFGTAPGIAIVR